MNIKNLENLIGTSLQKDGKKFISCDYKRLLPPGENYGSTMLALNIKVKNQNDEVESVYCVAKTVPPPSKAVWELFNVPVTFKKEIAHYNTIFPMLNEFGKENGIDNLLHFIAKCYGARISLNPKSDTVDNDAAFVLENLKVKGYIIGDRFTGFDMETAKLILKNMAAFHASMLAFKLAKPEEFQVKIRPHLGKGIVFVASDGMLDNLIKCIQKFASRNPKFIPLLSRVADGVRKMKNLFMYPKIREPFATVVHCDMWTNNMLIKYENGKPVHNIFVDFQINEYGSPTRDLLFFIYSSVRLDVIETKIDELIKFYYDNLIEILKKLHCDVSIFTYGLFLEEIAELAQDTEFAHIVFMLTPLFTLKGQAKELTEWTPDHLAPENEDSLHENYYERLNFTISDFAERNWI